MEYYWIIRRMSNKFDYRLKMVELAEQAGVSEAARVFSATRPTVRKWRDRYRQEGLPGLKDKSKAPHNIPHKMSTENEGRIEDLRKRHKRWGAIRLKRRYRLPGSHTAIHRVMKQKDLVKKKDKYSAGTILDPKEGKVYTCKLWVENGDLMVRGYIAFFFRTQTWHRVE